MKASRQSTALRLAAALLAALGLAVEASAEDPCLRSFADRGTGLVDDESGVGGTGLGGDEGGIGGTGLTGDEGGIGGTGLTSDEGGTGWTGWSGVGGTGVVGTITGFGSICVNGLHIDYDAETPVLVDGQPTTAEKLAVGQVVDVEARAAQGRLQARRIAVRHAVVGPISEIDVLRGRLRVAGQSVAVPRGLGNAGPGGADPLASLPPGAFVEVSGLRRSDGVIVASRVAAAPRSEVVVHGPATRFGPKSLYVSDLRVGASSGAIEKVRAAGGIVRVSGRWNTRTATLEAARIDVVSGLSSEVRRMSVEGYIQERSGRVHFRLPGVKVDASDVAGQLGEAGRDARVRVAGRLLEDGTLRAERVEIDRRRLDLWDDARRGDELGAAEREEWEDRSGHEDRSERGDWEGHSEWPEYVERPERMERPERTERPERVERWERVERPERVERWERPGHR